MKPRVLVGMPMGSRNLDVGTAVAWMEPSRRTDLFDVELSRTTGGYTYSTLWAEALNKRAEGLTHFAMIHTDVDPERHWLDKLWEVLHTPRPHKPVMYKGTDLSHAVFPRIASCVIAMKDMLDESSTGYVKKWGPDRNVKKLKLEQTDALPPVFSISDVRPDDWDNWSLCLNTGLWLADIRPLPDGTDWAKEIQWTGKGGFKEDPKTGRFEPWFESEDWLESRKLAELLDPEEIVAVGTKTIEIGHWGWFRIGNKSSKTPKCRTCRDMGLIDNKTDTIPCPECQPSKN